MSVKVSVKDFIKNVSTTLVTKEIQQAIDYCYLQGGGIVEFPKGVYPIGDIRIRSNITLLLRSGAILKGSRNMDDYFQHLDDRIEPYDYDQIEPGCWGRIDGVMRMMHKPGSRFHCSIIRGYNAENIAIIGEKDSYIDGCNCYDELGEEYYRGPHAIGLHNCKNILLKGYTIKNSGNWAHKIMWGQNIHVEDITVLGGHDGIHMRSCDDVHILKSNFFTGDDCIAGFDNTNVLVEECELNSACSALRFGGTDVLVQNCHMYGPAKYIFRGCLTKEEKITGAEPKKNIGGHRYNMLSVFTYFADKSFAIRNTPGNIVIRNCRIENADRFIHYNFSGSELWQKACPLKDITFEDITATGIRMPLNLYGDDVCRVTLKLKNVNVEFAKTKKEPQFINAANYDKIIFENINCSAICMKQWGESGTIESDRDYEIILAKEPFQTEAI